MPKQVQLDEPAFQTSIQVVRLPSFLASAAV
jgi:hypothetical protein